MGFTFKAAPRLVGGPAIALYENSDDLPFTAPIDHINRVKFHSDFDYIQILATLTGSATFPSRAGGSNGQYITTFQNGPSHGRPGIPLVFGYLNVGGSNVAFAGSVPIQAGAGTAAQRIVSLGASPTHIVFNEMCNIAVGATLASITINYTVFVTDEILS